MPSSEALVGAAQAIKKPKRQDLSGVTDQGKLVGRGGREQTLGASAQRRIAKPKPTLTATTGGGLEAPAPSQPPAWQQIGGGRGSAAANRAQLEMMQRVAGQGGRALPGQQPPGMAVAKPALIEDAIRLPTLPGFRGIGGGMPQAPMATPGGNPALAAEILQAAGAADGLGPTVSDAVQAGQGRQFGLKDPRMLQDWRQSVAQTGIYPGASGGDPSMMKPLPRGGAIDDMPAPSGPNPLALPGFRGAGTVGAAPAVAPPAVAPPAAGIDMTKPLPRTGAPAADSPYGALAASAIRGFGGGRAGTALRPDARNAMASF